MSGFWRFCGKGRKIRLARELPRRVLRSLRVVERVREQWMACDQIGHYTLLPRRRSEPAVTHDITMLPTIPVKAATLFLTTSRLS